MLWTKEPVHWILVAEPSTPQASSVSYDGFGIMPQDTGNGDADGDAEGDTDADEDADADADTEADTDTDTDTETDADADAELDAELDAGTDADADTDTAEADAAAEMQAGITIAPEASVTKYARCPPGRIPVNGHENKLNVQTPPT
jgi:hypothetical protein